MIYEPAGYPVCFTDYHDFEGEGYKKTASSSFREGDSLLQALVVLENQRW